MWSFLETFVFSEKSQFYVSWSINHQNSRMCCKIRIVRVIHILSHSLKVSMCCAVMVRVVIGPLFFKGHAGKRRRWTPICFVKALIFFHIRSRPTELLWNAHNSYGKTQRQFTIIWNTGLASAEGWRLPDGRASEEDWSQYATNLTPIYSHVTVKLSDIIHQIRAGGLADFNTVG